jgi:hypothetical protein
MARFSLRNQDKIQDSFGESFLNYLLKSLKFYFENTKEIKEYIYENEKYKVIHVNNIQPHTDSTFELYVISKNFDVYNLAYKSCMS